MLRHLVVAVSAAAWLLSVGGGSALSAEGASKQRTGRPEIADLCPDNYVCMWLNFGYEPGVPVRWTGPGCKNLPGPYNNVMSSYWNRKFVGAWMYDAPDCTGALVRWLPGQSRTSFTGPQWGFWNNRASSVRVF
jgi:hypothetical protein